jgi:hypothetical protein
MAINRANVAKRYDTIKTRVENNFANIVAELDVTLDNLDTYTGGDVDEAKRRASLIKRIAITGSTSDAIPTTESTTSSGAQPDQDNLIDITNVGSEEKKLIRALKSGQLTVPGMRQEIAKGQSTVVDVSVGQQLLDVLNTAEAEAQKLVDFMKEKTRYNRDDAFNFMKAVRDKVKEAKDLADKAKSEKPAGPDPLALPAS